MPLVLGDLVQLLDLHHREQAEQFLADPEEDRIGLHGDRGVPERDAHPQPHRRHEGDGGEIHHEVIETLAHLIDVGRHGLLDDRSFALTDARTRGLDEQDPAVTGDLDEAGGVMIWERRGHRGVPLAVKSGL